MWAEGQPSLRGVALSIPGEHEPADHFSDLELLLLPSDGRASQSVLSDLGSQLRSVARLDFSRISVFYLSDPFAKVELAIAAPVAPAAAGESIEGPDPARSGATVLWARDEAASRALQGAAFPPPMDGDARKPGDGTARFLYSYESFHPAFHRTDHLEAFYRYAVAFHELGGVLSSVYGPKAPIDPRGRLLDALDAVDPELRRRFDACAPEWGRDLTPLLLRKELLFDLFETALGDRSGAPSPMLETARAIREYVRRRYPPLLRWRDLAGRGPIAPRRVFRAARLDRYPSEVLNSFLRNEGIRTVLDLRTDEELASHHYAAGALEGVRYVRLPVWPSAPYPRGANEVQRLRFLYRHILDDPAFPDWMTRFLSEVAEPSALPLVVHCYAGADRTGILVATLLSLAGASEEEVVEDYLITSAHVRREYIDAFLDELRRRGGARAWLEAKGVSKHLLERAVRSVAPER